MPRAYKAAVRFLSIGAGRKVVAELKTLETRHGVHVEEKKLGPGQRGGFEPSTNALILDPTKLHGSGDYAHALVHEATHASQKHRLAPRRDGLFAPWEGFKSASAYADHQVEMEARAEARAIETFNARGRPLGTRLEYHFKMGYASVEGSRADKREAGIQAMIKAINDGLEWSYLRPSCEKFWTEANEKRRRAPALHFSRSLFERSMARRPLAG